MGKKRLGELLRESELIDEETLNKALEMQRSTGERLGTTLLRLKVIDEGLLARVLSQQHAVVGVDPVKEELDSEAVGLLEFTQAMRLGALPLYFTEGRLAVAMADPTDAKTLAELERLTGREVVPFVAPQMALWEAVKDAYGRVDVGQLSERDRLLRIASHLRKLAAEIEAIVQK